jgi:hypothetical protein
MLWFMRHVPTPDRRLVPPAALIIAAIPLLASVPHPRADPPSASTEPPGVTLPAGDTATAPARDPSETSLNVVLGDAAFGLSRNLRAHIARPGEAIPLHLEWPATPVRALHYRWHPVQGTPLGATGGLLERGDVARAPITSGVYELEVYDGPDSQYFGDAFRLVVTVPFDRKRNGHIGAYRMGRWPTEGSGREDAYAPPAGFVEVTPRNQTLRLSEHLTLDQFLTKGQDGVWPKYLALEPVLIDKLELVLLELRAMGIQADRMVVMSGFRTPHYNSHTLGNAPTSLSRHQFGDAADVWIDNEGDWYMSDLNGDGRRDLGDARVILEAVERIERRHPELVGGAGLYRANRVRGPFIHIDVRGTRVRW